ncbi:MAG: phosphate acyltransferase PlsX [Acidimicrobiia bacterium]
MRCTVAVDAMGGDNAPAAIVAGACDAAATLDVGVLLFGDEAAIRAALPDGICPPGVEIAACSEVIAMEEEPAHAVRAKKDSSIVRAAESVRDGRAHAMVGAGNTGATMAGALLRMGRLEGVARPAIAVPVPVPGSRPQLLVDGGATVDCAPEWLVQHARLGRAYARVRLGQDEPTIGLLSNGEEPGKGDELRKKVFPLLEAVPGFIGNCEGRDLVSNRPDVVVTDGFTGNIALKTLEGAMKAIAGMVFGVLSRPELKDAAKVIAPALLEAAGELDPEATGGAALLGLNGVCIISHGSSGPRAIVNAIRVAAESYEADLVGCQLQAVADAR